jgi:ribonuclease III
LSFLSRLFKKFRRRGKEKKITDVFSEDRISSLEKLIGCSIKNRNYYIQALVHRSYLEDSSEMTISNERLEFLGDSVLNLVAAEYLFAYFPEKDEGFLTKVRAKVVNRIALADAAENIKLSDFILIGKNLSQSFINGSKTVLSDAFEALVGAIYLDSGIISAKKFIIKSLIEPVINEGELLVDENFKSQLLEYAQANKMDIPVYTVANEEGPQHDRTFTVKVLIGGIDYGLGVGKNKKSAEQNAAKAAMLKILSGTD